MCLHGYYCLISYKSAISSIARLRRAMCFSTNFMTGYHSSYALVRNELGSE